MSVVAQRTQTRAVVFASNRGPLSFVRSGDGYEAATGIGAVSEVLTLVGDSLRERLLWVAPAVSEDEYAALGRPESREALAQLPYTAEYLTAPPAAFRGYYEQISNRVLWFACHDLWDDLGIASPGAGWRAHWTSGYDAVNRSFAESIARGSDPSSLVFFHDYHLLTAPRHLRALRPEQASGVFVHPPWSPAGFRRLPRALVRELVHGMLAADLVGFQVPAWCEGFLRTCVELGLAVDGVSGAVDHDGRRAWVRPYAVPVDVPRIAALARADETERWATRLSALPRPLVVRVDRVEPCKNQLRGFEAYELLLRRGDEAALRSTFVASLLARRSAMDEYREYRRHVDAAVARIERLKPGGVRLFDDDDRPRALAALRLYDILLVNTLTDGMNLVSKEGAVLNERDGVLVLSRTTGSAAELGPAAVVVDDAADVRETADALATALRMSAAERARRGRWLREAVASRSPGEWFDAQVEDLLRISSGEPPLTEVP